MALTNKLTAIADAIRAKTGGTDLLSLDGMASAVNGMVLGDGAEVQAMLDGLIDRTDTEITTYATSIGNHAFYLNKKVANLNMPNVTSIGENAFYGCHGLALTSLPSGLASIGKYGFYNCISLALTSLPSGVTSIAASAFADCTNLTSLTFKGKPSSMHSGVFSYSTNLTTINVPWAEGEVANAPWGATNATINYNYTGE